MFDRHLLGDVAMAVLIAVPAVAVARPGPSTNPPIERSSDAAQPTQNSAPAADLRPSLFG